MKQATAKSTQLSTHGLESKLARNVICDRCHRSIPENLLARHIATHKTRKPKPLRHQQIDERASTLISPPSSSPAFENFMASHWKTLPRKSNFTPQQVQDVFSDVLRGMGLPPTTLEVGVRRAKTKKQRRLGLTSCRSPSLGLTGYATDGYLPRGTYINAWTLSVFGSRP